jgi:hypothetical protein
MVKSHIAVILSLLVLVGCEVANNVHKKVKVNISQRSLKDQLEWGKNLTGSPPPGN